MAFLSKIGSVSNSVAALIIFFAWYLAASTTTLLVANMYGRIIGLTAWTFATVVIFMTIMFIFSRLIKRTDVVDMAWGLAFIVAAVVSLFLSGYEHQVGLNVQTLVTLLVIVWGSRLSYVIFKRLRTHPEDKRYVGLRSSWKGNEALNTYVRIFFTQALLATVVSIAVIHVNLSLPTTFNYFVGVGFVVWLIGFFFEAVGDLQLKRHLTSPANKGKLMTSGLWKYTRHPNYFGEATMWWGIFIIALSTPYGWVGIVTPVVITYLLLFVSGVPMTEKAFEGRPGWIEYKRRTSVFLPLPPKA